MINTILENRQCKTRTQDIKIISWNMNIKNVNIECKVKELLQKNADIIMLQECTQNIDNYFNNYISYDSVHSHCGIINLLIHKRMKSKLLTKFIENNMLIFHIDTKFGQMIVGSVHLQPSDGINDKILRTISIYKAVKFLKDQKLTKLPIIIGGDTNMRDDEEINELSDNILDDIYNTHKDETKYPTWPNINSLYKNKSKGQLQYRFDRFFYSNITSKTFNTFPSNLSDHMMIETNVTFMKIIHDTINIKLEKIISNRKRERNNSIVIYE